MRDIFYFTDIHGMYNLYRAAMDYCLEQDPECAIIFGGDAIDRGPDGYKIMKELLDNPQVCYLMGNHEDMFIQAAVAIKEDYKDPLDEEHIMKYLTYCANPENKKALIAVSLDNGGVHTLKDWMLDGMPNDIIGRILHLPITFVYENIDFCHAGGRYKEFKRVADAEYQGEWPARQDEWFLMWDRTYLGHGWAPDRTCIFGHTPTPYIATKYYGKDKSLTNVHPCAYYATLDNKWTGRKIDMDTAAVASGRLYVLNILTMQAQGFYDKDIGNNEIHEHNIEKIEVIQF